ncbi:MAG TPA: hypothetical protein VHV83_12505 [Armatimonadota bacterium]|nr:hypothetical protein [Armatimonadota bacterium]
MLKHYRMQLDTLYTFFRSCPDPNAREHDDGWCTKQILGHLLDSVSNNHQRLLRFRPGQTLQFPAYDQVSFVTRAHYSSFDYMDLLTLWYLHNQLLLHIIEHIPVDDMGSLIEVGDQPAITIKQLIADYYAHMEIHHRQAIRICEKNRV